MTLNDLLKLFDTACEAQQHSSSEDVSLWSCRAAGLETVVMALRDDFTAAVASGVAVSNHINTGTAAPGSIVGIADMIITEILASDGVKSEGSG